MTTTNRLQIPLLVPGQLAKETTHNEALAKLDLIVAAAAIAVERDDPPANPAPGDCYILGNAPTGEWSGQANALAGFTESGWRFAAPAAGMRVLDRTSGCVAEFDGIDWTVGKLRGEALAIGGTQVVGNQQAAIADPAGGTTVDVEARASLGSILSALRDHGLIAS